MRKTILAPLVAAIVCAPASPSGSTAEVRPRIRAVTAFIEIDSTNYTKQTEAVALQLAKTTGWTYEDIDATPAPLGDRSIATAMEDFIQPLPGTKG